MAGMQGEARLAKIAEKWHALARRRLASIRELERSGRWKRYYTDEQYALCVRSAERTALLWSKLTSRQSAFAPHMRPGA